MRILVLGAGGIGGYFGGRLIQAGADVTFLVREARAKKLANGLEIVSPFGDATIEVQAATKVSEPFDLILVSCKAYDLDAAIAAIGPAVGDHTTILPLLNGLAHFDRLDEVFAPERTIGGLAHISVTLGKGGQIRHLNKLQTLTFGARDPSQAARCDAIGEFFETATFEAKRSGEVLQAMWEKFAFIAAAGALTCLMRACIRDIMAADDGRRLALQMLDECNGVAAASGFPIRDKGRDWAQRFLTDETSDFKQSMLLDIERGARIEADHIVGDMIRRGAAHSVATDLLKVAYCQLQAYQNRQQAA